MEIILINQHRRRQRRTIDIASGQIPFLLTTNSFVDGNIEYNLSASQITFPENFAATAEKLELTVYTNTAEWLND